MEHFAMTPAQGSVKGGKFFSNGPTSPSALISKKDALD